MFRIHDEGTRLCDGLSRREWLRIGGLGACGLSLPALLSARHAEAEAAGAPRVAQAPTLPSTSASAPRLRRSAQSRSLGRKVRQLRRTTSAISPR